LISTNLASLDAILLTVPVKLFKQVS